MAVHNDASPRLGVGRRIHPLASSGNSEYAESEFLHRSQSRWTTSRWGYSTTAVVGCMVPAAEEGLATYVQIEETFDHCDRATPPPLPSQDSRFRPAEPDDRSTEILVSSHTHHEAQKTTG